MTYRYGPLSQENRPSTSGRKTPDQIFPDVPRCSRYVVNWELRESMTEADIEIILQWAKVQLCSILDS